MLSRSKIRKIFLILKLFIVTRRFNKRWHSLPIISQLEFKSDRAKYRYSCSISFALSIQDRLNLIYVSLISLPGFIMGISICRGAYQTLNVSDRVHVYPIFYILIFGFCFFTLYLSKNAYSLIKALQKEYHLLFYHIYIIEKVHQDLELAKSK